MSIHDYELLSILDKYINTNSRIFKVKSKASGEFYVWIVIDSQNLTKQNITILEEKFQARKLLEHSNLLEFHELFDEHQSQLHYLVVQYCRHGSLKDLMDLAFRDNSRLCEEFLCKILYQIALFAKTIPNITKFDIKDTFFDEDYNVKLFNFHLSIDNFKTKSIKTSSLGIMLFEVSTLIKFKKNNFEKELKSYASLYSKGFLSLITTLVKDNNDLKKNVDKILCNSTLLLKTTQWSKQKILVKIDDTNICMQIPENVDGFALQIEKLRETAISLQRKEKELKEREYTLLLKEKKIASLEKKLKESLKKVNRDLVKYNSALSCNCNKVPTVTEQKVQTKENLDSTYISCGDSVIVPTSKKLNANEIIKPATFTRTLSEKRIKFKGHSPLKDIDFNRRRSVRHAKTQKEAKTKNTTEWITCSDDTDRSSLTYQKTTNKKGKQLFHTYENNDSGLTTNVTKPVQWTEENKRHAFELLRIMNSDKENKPPDVKHTYL